ncbi:MAG: hypothetical protein K1060chlam1_01032 [Candidatus Anoxychlamydiales bacterium]|nr:hypothetical protein [Candidatus Anoxychlamydiales bacterium]
MKKTPNAILKKTISLILILSAISYSSWFLINKHNKYLFRETFVKELNKKVFKSKIKKKPPTWMCEQIQEEFEPFVLNGITSKTVEKTFKKIKKTSPGNVIRYRIINNELFRYFDDDETVSLKDSSLEKAIKTILYFEPIKDIDIIISHQDGIPIGRDPEGFYITEKKEMQSPILCSAKKKNLPLVVLIPDWRSVSRWWLKEISSVLKATEKNNWESKKNYAFWRGSCTNGIRPKLCKMALKYPNHLYAKINSKVENEDLQMQFEQEGIYCSKGWYPMEKVLENKYLPLMDGVMSAAPAFQSRLLSNSLTLKQNYSGVQWFFKPLKPYVHYVPIKQDISDLIEKIEWAKKNDGLCKEISKNATDFALNNLMFEDVYLYFYLVLKKYSSLSLINSEEIKKEIKNNSNWMNIQKREKLKKNLLKSGFRKVCNRAEPDF